MQIQKTVVGSQTPPSGLRNLNQHLPSFLLKISGDKDGTLLLKKLSQEVVPYTYVGEEGSFHFPNKFWALWRTCLRTDLSPFLDSFYRYHRDSWACTDHSVDLGS